MKMKEGDIVSVYRDPVSCEDLEGKAELVKRLRPFDPLDYIEYWSVRFLNDIGDGRDDEVFSRFINTDNH